MDNRWHVFFCIHLVQRVCLLSRSCPTCSLLRLSSLQQACYQTCTKPVHNKQFLLCHNKFQQGNKPVVGKQIENVSKEKNRTKWTLPAASLSHSIIAIAILNHIGETIVSILWLNAKAAVLFLKNSSDFQNPNSNLLTCAIAIFL